MERNKIYASFRAGYGAGVDIYPTLAFRLAFRPANEAPGRPERGARGREG